MNVCGVLTLIDNIWVAGLLFKPLAYGVTMSVQVLIKYVGGYSDCFMGSVATCDDAVAKFLGDVMWDIGWSVLFDDVYIMLCGLWTLATCLFRHAENGFVIVCWL